MSQGTPPQRHVHKTLQDPLSSFRSISPLVGLGAGRSRQRRWRGEEQAGPSCAQSGRWSQGKAVLAPHLHFAYFPAAHQEEKEERTNTNQSSNNSLRTVLIILLLPSYCPTGIFLLSGLGSFAHDQQQQQKLTMTFTR